MTECETTLRGEVKAMAVAVKSFRLASRRQQEENQKFYKMLDDKIDEGILKIQKLLTEHSKFLKDLAYTNSCVDETLCKVLLAIKQNEYLQPWIPGVCAPQKQIQEDTENGR